MICIHSNIIADESNGIMYSQNELNNSYYTIIQLVYYLRISYLQKNFHTLPFYSFDPAEDSLIVDFGDLTFPSLITIPSANKGLITSVKN